MATIQALQAKADKAMGKDLTHKEENKHENESDSEDEYSNESSDRDDNCTKNADENDISTSKCNSTKQVFSNNQRQGKHDLRSESIFWVFFSVCVEKSIVDINRRWKYFNKWFQTSIVYF